MPITVRCHACDGRSLCPDKTAGKRIKCPRCGAGLQVPTPAVISEPAKPSRAAPDWAAAPPPVRASAPVQSEGADWSASPPPVRAGEAAANEPAPQELDAARWDMGDNPAPHYAPPEPWYYGFLEKYTLFFMWLWIIVVTLPFLAFTLLQLGAGSAGLAALVRVADKPQPILGGGCLLFVVWFIGAVFYVALVCAILFVAARVLLAVDAARNLRAIRFNSSGPH